MKLKHLIIALVVIIAFGGYHMMMKNRVDDLEGKLSLSLSLVKANEEEKTRLENINDQLEDDKKALSDKSDALNVNLQNKREKIEALESQVKNLSKEPFEMNSNNYSVISSFFGLLDLYRKGEYDKAYELIEDSYYYIDHRDDELVAYYINLIFDKEDVLTIENDPYQASLFLIKDDDGNEVYFSSYERNGKMYCYTTLAYAPLFDLDIENFVNALRTENLESLVKQMVELDLSPSDEDALRVINMYKEDYDLSTLNYEFVRASGDGFEYRLSGSKDGVEHSELIHINVDDWTYIKDYRGRYEWTGHNPPEE